MSECAVVISSENFSGQTTNVVFVPDTGGTVNLGVKVFPFTYESNYLYGTFYCYIPSCKYTYIVDLPGPTPTPTVTATFTPTPPPTPTPTPAIVYMENLWTDSDWNTACSNAGVGPSNVTIYTFEPFSALELGDYVYGDPLCTTPPTGASATITDGATWIQVDPDTGLIVDKAICP